MAKEKNKKIKRLKKSRVNKVGILKLMWRVSTVRQKFAFFGLMILGMITAFAILVPTQIISIIVSRFSGETVLFFGIELSSTLSYVEIIVIGAVITLIMRTVKCLYELEIEKLVKRVLANLRIETFDWLVSPRKNMDLKMTQGDAVYRMNQAPDVVSNVMCDFFKTIIPDILAGVIAFAYIIILDWQSLPILLAGILLIFVCVVVRSKIEKTISFRTEQAKSVMSSMASNTITNLPLINLYKSMSYETKLFTNKVDNFYGEQKKQINLRLIYWSCVHVIEVVSTFVIIYLCAKGIYLGTMLVGNIIIITNYVAQIYEPIKTIGYFSARWVQCSVAVDRLQDLMPKKRDLLPTISNINEKIESLELKYICAKNSENFKIKNINAKFKVKELTVISGESGSGKSTLIKLICGLCDKSSGDIILNDKAKLSSAYLLIDKMSVSMQDAYIFNRDVVKNVLYPDGTLIDEKSSKILEQLSLENVIKRKYDNKNEHNLENMLSGGEKKRIGIARALIKDADLFIFDEPTNDLDNNNAKKVINAINKLKDNAIVIIVTHDDRVKAIADQMLVFTDRGKLEKIK